MKFLLPSLEMVFHVMDYPKVPVKHDAKNSYFVAFSNESYAWNEDKMAELTRRMALNGKPSDDIESELYYNTHTFKGCIDRRVPRESTLDWRI